MQNRDGGGSVIDALVYNYLETTIAKPKKVLELCAGPAFMGKKLYENNFCDELHVSDINRYVLPDDDFIKTIISDGFDAIKDKYDLIVCNPPWFCHNVFFYSKHVDPQLTVDAKWRLHKKIYGQASQYLNDGGHILMIECQLAVDVDTFDSPNLKLVEAKRASEISEEQNHMTRVSYFALYKKETKNG